MKLIVKDFGFGTRGLARVEDKDKSAYDSTAVCLLPGTEVAFTDSVKRAETSLSEWGGVNIDWAKVTELKSRVAIFRQVDKEQACRHHDALDFATDHDCVLINHLLPGQVVTVLALPAAPKNEAEADEQKRLAVVA